MPAPASVRTLLPTEAAYVAGLIDGEGTISLTRKHAGENRQLAVSIANTELAILEYALRVIGVGKITRKRTSQAHHAPGFCYAISNRQALALLKQIHEHLRSYKRRRAALVLDRYLAVTPRNGKYTAALAAERASFEADFAALRPERAKVSH